MKSAIVPFRPCPYCDARSVTPIVRWAFPGWTTQLAIGKCTSCGLVYATNSDEVDMTNQKYVHWRPANDKDAATEDRFEFQRVLLDYLKPRLKPGSWILDYGAGYCTFLRVAREAGFNVEGVNPCLYLAAWAQQELGIHVYPVFGENLRCDRKYDLVFCQQTLEHLINPRADLEKMFAILQPGGYAYIEVPNWITVRRLFGGGRDHLRNPSHYNYFTPRTLTLLCKRAGFEMVDISPPVAVSIAGRVAKRLLSPLGGR